MPPSSGKLTILSISGRINHVRLRDSQLGNFDDLRRAAQGNKSAEIFADKTLGRCASSAFAVSSLRLDAETPERSLEYSFADFRFADTRRVRLLGTDAY